MTDYRPALSPETRHDLTRLALLLGFYLNGKPSVPQLLEAIGEVTHADPGGTHMTLKVLLKANGLFPDRPADLTDAAE